MGPIRRSSANSGVGGAEQDPRRSLASVSALLEEPRVHDLIAKHSRPLVLEAIQAVLAGYRETLRLGDTAPETGMLIYDVAAAVRASEHDRIRPVVNATGIILHTGLGRAVLPEAAAKALADLDKCCNLQIDLDTGLRGKRNYMCEKLLCRLTGAEAALVVNNNAGATLLLLAALCAGKEVVVSRGQLIEIGGSYRLPDCIHASGAALVEVGTTNKTHLRDYESAVSENTGALMRVNPSNYRVIGFSQSVPTADLVALRDRLAEAPDAPELLVIDDLGCGALLNLEEYGLPHEPTVQDSVQAGADIVCFSGDKLIGGPQAGIVAGRKRFIDRIRKHPLTRMLRVGKLTDTALEHTLRLFLDPDTLRDTNPTLRMVTALLEALKARAEALAQRLGQAVGLDAQVEEGQSAMGGGSLPGTHIPTFVVALRINGMSPEAACKGLRLHEPPVVARIKDDAVLLDMRTLMEGDDDVIVSALTAITQGEPSRPDNLT